MVKVVHWCYENGQNKAATAFHFKVDRKRVREWIKEEERLKEMRKFTRKNKSGLSSKYPLAERKVYDDFQEARRNGKAIKH